MVRPVLMMEIPCPVPRACTRCTGVIPAGASYLRFDVGDVVHRVCLACVRDIKGEA